MVGIVVVSHSAALAEGVVALGREMGGSNLALEAAGGTEDESVLGTSAERVQAAIERAMSSDGVLVLMDLGSALMSAEFAIDLLGDTPGKVLLSEAPLVEGAVAAAAAASGGASLEEVAAEARGALAMKSSQLGVADGGGAPAERTPAPAAEAEPAPAADAETSILVRNAIGLHARPAARFVETVRRFDADLRVAKAPDGQPAKATSLTNVVALGARFGDTLLVSASGPQAGEAIAALQELAGDGFGDGVAAAPPPVASPSPSPVKSPTPTPTPPPTPTRAGPTNTNDNDGIGATGRTAAEPLVAGAVLTGVPASAGVAVGPAHHLRGAFAPPPDRAAEDPEREQRRLGEAIDTARTAIERDHDSVAARAGEAEAAIFNAHVVLLDDEALLEPAYRAIENGATAERAFYDAAQEVAARFRALTEPLLQERAADVLDVGRRVVEALTGGSDLESVPAGPTGIVIAGELTPADAA